MARLTRAELQERTRAKVLAAAREEFAEHGYDAARIDGIAERAELTRGAVYSNFPGKRALYFTVLADLAEADQPAPPDGPPYGPFDGTSDDTYDNAYAGTGGASGEPGRETRETLAAFARAWVTRLPLATDDRHGEARLGRDLMPVIIADELTRRPFAQLVRLNALLLGLTLERPPRTGPAGARKVRLAQTALTLLHGASRLAAAAPGFTEPFDVVTACGRLADLDLDDAWHPPTAFTPALPADQAWAPPAAQDTLRDEPALLTGDGVVAVVGLHRLAAAEEAVRAAPPGTHVTAVLVTGTPAELTPLARLALADLRRCLRQAIPTASWPPLQVVHDPHGELAAAAGVPAVSDGTEAAVRIERGRIVARADGLGACHAAATTETGTPHRHAAPSSTPSCTP
ncbi:TetR/AcrR family transcriptional regulator [Nonomuraea sp. NPDC047897]|uniref:TetR/AcrR family transcriptional regulator n=1 Tax=Nonomuraea sp. NPDC047897 TaxID=3364346 RepID=UPI0037205364